MTRAAIRPSLFVEVRLKRERRILNSFIEEHVEQWLRRDYTQLRVGQSFDDLRTLECSARIHSVRVTGYSRSKTFPDGSFHSLAETDLQIATYTLCQDGDDEDNTSKAEDDDASEQCNITQLPHETLEGLWESLIFDEPIAELALRTISQATQDRHDGHFEWQNTMLFHGPPGSGKTTLARALAQKLSIRLSPVYQQATLVQVNGHALFSRYFGESGKRVGKLFESILNLSSDDTRLVVVIFDEVESLACSRERTSQANEVGDAVRATNELLTGLDQLQFGKRYNVIFISTSNLITNMDSAFLDRCHYQQFVGSPAVETAYELLRSWINQYIQSGLVFVDSLVYNEDSAQGRTESINRRAGLARDAVSAATPPTTGNPSSSGHLSCIPDVLWATTNWPASSVTVTTELRRIASSGKTFSARKLKALLALARYKYTVVEEACALSELLAALERVVQEHTSDSGEVKDQVQQIERQMREGDEPQVEQDAGEAGNADNDWDGLGHEELFKLVQEL